MPGKIDYSPGEYLKAFNRENMRPFITSAKLLNAGMCACDKCGRTTDIDYKYCDFCLEVIMIVKK